jgi:mono/diheme cytochrome c family protein
MPAENSPLRAAIRKVVIGGIIAVVVIIATKAMHFPPVFQIMFVIYAILGTAVFILLDAPSLRPLAGGAAILALLAFYAVISVVFVAGANVLPQYDPRVEKGKIDKIVKPKLSATEKGKIEELIKRSEDLNAQSQAILKRLEAIGGAGAKAIEASVKSGAPTTSKPGSAGGDLVSLGKEQYDLQECYNCHKIGGKGSVKKRGPILDNIGNLMKPEEMKEKVLNPRSWMAEGFEKEYNKKQMPDKYKELMSDQEVNSLVAYLSTLKDSSVETPKPVKK